MTSDTTAETAAAQAPRNRRGRYASGQRRRDEFANGALEIFATHGFRRLSLRRIAEELGVSHAALSYHFPTKEDLLEAVFTLQAERERPAFTQALAERGLLDSLPDLIRTNNDIPGLIQLEISMIAEAIEPDHPAHDWAQQRLDGLTETLKEELAKEHDRGRLRDGLDIDRTARQIAAMVRGLQLHWLYRRGMPTDRFLSDFVDLIRADR